MSRGVTSWGRTSRTALARAGRIESAISTILSPLMPTSLTASRPVAGSMTGRPVRTRSSWLFELRGVTLDFRVAIARSLFILALFIPAWGLPARSASSVPWTGLDLAHNTMHSLAKSPVRWGAPRKLSNFEPPANFVSTLSSIRAAAMSGAGVRRPFTWHGTCRPAVQTKSVPAQGRSQDLIAERAVPAIDIAPFLLGGPRGRQAIAARIDETLRPCGFLIL